MSISQSLKKFLEGVKKILLFMQSLSQEQLALKAYFSVNVIF